MLLAYDDHGPGPVVVLLHGFPLNRSLWEYQVGSIGSRYRLILPDLRGHGESAAPEGTYTMDAMADDVLELLDVLQLREPVVLGGLSMGGYVALSLIERFPERFRGLILMSTRAEADSPEARHAREDLVDEIEGTQDVRPVVDAMLPRLLSPTTRVQRPEVVARVRSMMEKTAPRGVIGALRGMASRPDRTGVLAGINVPTLLLFGRDDPITPPEVAQKFAAAIPRAQPEVIDGAGHLAPIERPDDANRAILAFLAELA
ncbi:MAG: alpha/beta fold hydrolase [Isosphaeraceae bacterium]|nr:alpha/beta fold hydrolase [Isosphaeraceae bacterium]